MQYRLFNIIGKFLPKAKIHLSLATSNYFSKSLAFVRKKC